MKKTRGFIYLWYDRKHKRFYLGKHWGEPDDGYDCSSRWMRAAKKRRPKDFKRRILEWVFDHDLLAEREEAWGNLIKNEELRIRYYNIRKPIRQWHDHPERRKTVGEKISRSNTGRKETPENKRKRFQNFDWSKGVETRKKNGSYVPWNKGMTKESAPQLQKSPEARAKIKANHGSKKGVETRKKNGSYVPWNKGMRKTHDF